MYVFALDSVMARKKSSKLTSEMKWYSELFWKDPRRRDEVKLFVRELPHPIDESVKPFLFAQLVAVGEVVDFLRNQKH
jgi:hypothetical protein